MSRQYLNAAKIVQAVLSGQSLKKYCAQKGKVGKEEYALACETLKYNAVIDSVLLDCDCRADKLKVDEFVLKVMFFELFFGKKKIKGGGVVKRVIMSNYTHFATSLRQELLKRGKHEYHQLLTDNVLKAIEMPKYIRINTIKTTADSGIEVVMSLFPQVISDPEIPNLLKIPSPCHGISDLDGVNNGHLIIQDKASCFPSQILFDEWYESGASGDFLDACAAPGNKTSHLSALSWNSFTNTFGNSIFAFDRNPDRCELLRSRMYQAGATNVCVSCENFLDVDTTLPQYERVTSILVDPSCSGSGVIRSLDRVLEHQTFNDNSECCDNERLLKLAKFQIAVISKAMSFPSVHTIVYSTCSVHEIENEAVVAEILKNNTDWQLKCPARFSTWKRKGFHCSGLSKVQADCLVRCHPEDGMNGFFVSLFVRKSAVFLAQKRTLESCEVPPVTHQKRRRVRTHWKPVHKLI